MQKAVKQNGVIRSIIRGILGGDDGYTPPPQAALFFPFVSSLFGRVDQVNTVANFSRAPGVSTVEDFEGVLHNCIDGEARFWKARRVENIYIGNSDTIDVLVGTPLQANKAYAISATGLEDDSLLGLSGSGIPSVALVADTSQRVGTNNGIVITTIDGTLTLTPIAGSFENILVEEMPIALDQEDIFSEYVSVGTGLVAPWHGANVDGVKYFPTDRDGNFINDLRGCLVEAGDAGYDPISGVQGTTQDETLNVARPVMLTLAAANNLVLSLRSFTVSDDANIGQATTLRVTGNTDLISMANTDNLYVGGLLSLAALIIGQDNLSKGRNHILAFSDTLPGTNYQLNEATATAANSTGVDLSNGDGVIQLLSNDDTGDYMNAGISLLAVLDQS